MADERFPIVGGDRNQWGSILNALLGVSLNADGTLKDPDIAQYIKHRRFSRSHYYPLPFESSCCFSIPGEPCF